MTFLFQTANQPGTYVYEEFLKLSAIACGTHAQTRSITSAVIARGKRYQSIHGSARAKRRYRERRAPWTRASRFSSPAGIDAPERVARAAPHRRRGRAAVVKKVGEGAACDFAGGGTGGWETATRCRFGRRRKQRAGADLRCGVEEVSAEAFFSTRGVVAGQFPRMGLIGVGHV
jgi:hypothetical protein